MRETPSTPKRRRIWLPLVFIIFALLGAGTAWLLAPEVRQRLRQQVAGGGESDGQMPGRDKDPGSRFPGADTTPPPPGSLGADTAANAQLRITCVYGTTPVADVPIDIKVVSNVAGVPRSELLQPKTDAGGVVRFAVKGVVTSLVAGVVTDQWRSPARLAAADFVRNVATDEFEATLKLVPLVRLYVDVKYDDDTPYDGQLEMLSPGWIQSTMVVMGRCEVQGVPVADITCCARPRRAGYSTLFQNVPASQVVADARIELVLGKSKWPASGLTVRVAKVVDRYGVDAAINLYLRVVHDDSGRTWSDGRMAFNKQDDAWYADYNLMPGTYTVTVRHQNLVGSRTVVLGVNEVVDLELNLEPGATVRATILDDRGQPLHRAVLRYPDGPYTTFPAKAKSNGTRALSRADGVAVLQGVAPVAQTLQVDAEGFEVFKLEIAPVAGAVMEVTCRLTPASARLAIRLANGVDGGKYLVSWMHPTVGGGFDNQDIEVLAGAELVVERVPRRKYNVVVRGAENGPIAQAWIDLAEPDCDGRVEVDVSKLKPRP
ncbi:MAG: hypothetical protein HS108_03345 [Planctomycetes bacterium]|nr:hypothetical protein [Planctomycetota bacterium]